MQLIRQYLKKMADGGCSQIYVQQKSEIIILNYIFFHQLTYLQVIGLLIPESCNF